MMAAFVYPEELGHFVESLCPFQVKDVGSSKWLQCHEIVTKLNQQAVLEAAEQREEEVKELIISKDKIGTLIHEAYCVLLWKTRILPHLLEVDPNPQATFLIYNIFDHEDAVISLLDATLIHARGCEALQDAAIDLVDYCAQAIAQLIGLTSVAHQDNEENEENEENTNYDVDAAILTELDRQKRDLIFKIGLRCISIVSYMAENANALPLSAARRMVINHDMPWIMSDLLHIRPWQMQTRRGLAKYIDEKWAIVHGDATMKLTKHEAQAWLCLRQLLFNAGLMEFYEINKGRRMHLSKCQALLQEVVLEQLPPLIQLKQSLCHMMASTDETGKKPFEPPTMLLDGKGPKIRDTLVKESECAGGFYEIARQQEKIFLRNDKNHIILMAQRLSTASNSDLLAEIEAKSDDDGFDDEDANKDGNKCANCKRSAEKKCEHCKTVFYCSPKCQLNNWPIHKKNCIKATF